MLEPRQPYAHGWHIEAICAHLEAVTYGRINRLLINVPPGSSKSLLASVLWPAWEWASGFASYRYLATSFNDGPVKRDTRKCRDLIRSPWYQALWPEVQLTRTGETSFANSQTGTREGVAFGSLTSQRGDRLIIDDPHSTETAESEAERGRAVRMFREGALDRLNDLEKSAIVVIMQRLHERDISGTIMELPELGFEHLMIPMEFEPDRRCTTSIGWTDPRTEPDELMEPVRFPRREVDRIKAGKGSYAYVGQYQQRPAPREGGFFNPDVIEIVDAMPVGVVEWMRGWDLAASTSGDWTAGALIGRMKDGRFIIADMARDRHTPDRRDAMIRSVAGRDGREVPISLPQDPGQAGKTVALHHVRMLAGYTVRATPETGDKVTRAEPFSAQVNVGNVIMLRGDWNLALTEELRNFPMGRHDDQVDALSRAFNELTLGDDKNAGFLALIRKENAERKEREAQKNAATAAGPNAGGECPYAPGSVEFERWHGRA